MKLLKLAICLVFLGTASVAVASNESKPYLDEISVVDNNVHIAVHCRTPFQTGSERYYLNIGDKIISKSFHSYEADVGILNFVLSADVYNQLIDNAEMSLSYGSAGASTPTWSLGFLNKASL